MSNHHLETLASEKTIEVNGDLLPPVEVMNDFDKVQNRVKILDFLGHSLELPLSNIEEKWLNDSCLSRYFRAAKGDLDNAKNRLLKTIIWRRKFKPDQITMDDISQEAESGKEFLKGFCKRGRPILYLIPSRENSKNYERMIKYVVFNMELAIKRMPEGVESIVIVLDYRNVTIMNSPPISVSKQFLQIIGDHYPERYE